MSELSDKHPMLIKDELVPRTIKLLRSRGRAYSDAPGLVFEQFQNSNLRIVLDEQEILQVHVNQWGARGDRGPWEECFRCKEGLIINYRHELAVWAVEELRRLMVLDDLANI